MPPNGNTVNIDLPRATYHHGDVRDQLIEAAIRLLEQRQSDDLSLRGLAREIGVSPTAVYRHFADKPALLRAIAERGFTLMANQQTEAARGATGHTAFAATGAAYVRFALRSPAVFRLMFANAAPCDLFALPAEALSPPLRLLRAHVAALVPPGASDATRKIVALRAWSLVHGLAVLALTGMIEVDDAMIDAVIAGAVSVKEKQAVLF